ncbi:DUF5518 domain-containing protein [Haloarchaeobius iranensis]|uniref:DUF5518 domain-containing protein n=1 Tax=Haloarchaeobius iranensis TaxID=996166 RepID=A0A1G9ZJ30_9EURY|nr:DUF5518 domain-containing protein [Haloarchaeobius iranensis]SDN20586.1 hypothetical protein SAMN05192554_12046 [Haloarchaeobius iranensis]
MSKSLHRRQDAWTYAIVGGLVAAPLVVVHNLYTGLGSEFSLNGVFVGGLVAGFLATRGSGDADRAAAGAGVLGGVPALAWMLPDLFVVALGGDGSWWFTVAEAAVAVVFVGFVLIIAVVAGVLGGVVGKWLASVVRRRTATHG